MNVLVSSDDCVWCDAELIQRVEGVMQGALGRFGDRLTRVEVHLSDSNSHNLGERDKGCRLEARLTGLSPVIAVHEASTLTEAIHAAADKLRRSLIRAVRDLDQRRSSVPQTLEPGVLCTLQGSGGGPSAR